MKRSFKINRTTHCKEAHMTANPTQQLILRRHTYESIQRLYNQSTKTLADPVQKKIHTIQQQLRELNRESDKKKKQFHKRHNGGHRRSVQHSVISRNTSHKADDFSIFQKKYNLILNSLIETNTSDISHRITKLLTHQKIFSGERPDVGSPENDQLQEYITHIATQIIDNAVMQPLYSKYYVTVMQNIFAATRTQPTNTNTIESSVMVILQSAIQSIDSLVMNKMTAKGYGKLVSQLYMQKILTKEQYTDFLQKWTTSFADNEGMISELFVHLFLTLAEDATHKKMWKNYVVTHIQPLWENENVNMRAQIRMWDIRDAYN